MSERYAFTVNFAGLAVGVSTAYEYTRTLCREYLTDEAPVFSVAPTDEMIRKECEDAGFPVERSVAESVCVYRAIAEQLPHYGRTVFHGAAIEYRGRAYLFTAASGTGKTTHIGLWREHLGDEVKIINGDKPILWFGPDGVTVCGTPYAGKEGWNRPVCVPLGGICLLNRGTVDRTERVPEMKAFLSLFEQIYRPKTAAGMNKALDLVQTLAAQNVVALYCTISEEAVRQVFGPLTGLDYDSCRI